MNFSDYQTEANKTAAYPNVGDNLQYLGLGIADEAGEVAGKIKKLMRDHNITSVTDLTDELRADIIKEVGDVLWYIARFATELRVDMADIAQGNVDKLRGRVERGTIHGNGDNR